MNTRLQAISRQLARIGASGSFATRRTAPAGDLHLEVKGVGRIRFPITAETARRFVRRRTAGTPWLQGSDAS